MKMRLLSRPFSFAQALVEYLCSRSSPPPSLCRRGCTVPGEGWSPAETEHSGEALRRRHGSVWRRARCASPPAATWIGACWAVDACVAARRAARPAWADAVRRGVAVTVGAVRVDPYHDDNDDHADD